MASRSTGFREALEDAGGVDHPELERVALLVGDGPVGVAPDDKRPLELAVEPAPPAVSSARATPTPGWNPAEEP
jgi:hypothetical protein